MEQRPESAIIQENSSSQKIPQRLQVMLILWIIYAVLSLITIVGVLSFYYLGFFLGSIPEKILSFFMLFLHLFSIMYFSYLLRGGKSVVLLYIVTFINLFLFPFGTALGIATCIILFQHPVSSYFKQK